MLKLSEKQRERKEEYRKIGEAISELAWRDRRGEHDYHLVTRPIQDPELSSRLEGPQMKSRQFIRTIRLSKKK